MKKSGILICAIALVLLLCSCDLSDVVSGGLIGVLSKPDPADPFAKQPYYLIYTSNGDGTCYVSEIILDPNNGAEVEIPKRSPNGEKVVGVRVELMPFYMLDNFPQVISKASMESMLADLEAHDIGGFDLVKFTSHYFLLSASNPSDNALYAACPLAQYEDVYVFVGSTETEYEFANNFFWKTVPFILKERTDFDSEVLELCKKHLTREQTESMLKLMGCRNVRSLSGIHLHEDIQYFSVMQYKNNTKPVGVRVYADMTQEQWAQVDCAQTNLQVTCTDGDVLH